MADANTNNILNRPFGLNITVPDRTIKQAQETAAKNVNLFAPVFDYINDNQNVFSGDVAKEIDKYNKMIFTVSNATATPTGPSNFDTRG
ncbi:MAG: hypothetical protein PHV37_09505 [Candidatus Gastranaerophilales bacterium]|nr:hypothetical protein [Candidatus Gastranaerophilales bacterium]